MKIKIFYLRILLLTPLLVWVIGLSGCNQLGPYKRNNTYDPSGVDFKPQSADSLYAVIQGNSVKLYWKDQSEYEQGYLVERSLGKNKEFETIGKLPPNSESYTDEIHTEPFWVRYRVIPYVQTGDSLHGRTIQTPYLPFIRFDNVLLGLKELSETKIQVSWPLLYSGNVSYLVERLVQTKDNEGVSHEVITPLDTVGNRLNSYVDSVALSSSIYRKYRVMPLSGGEEGPSSQVTILMPDPVTPGNLVLNKNGTRNDSITISWSACSLSDGFYLDMQPEGSDWNTVAQLGGDAQSYARTLSDTKISYSFRLRSITSEYTSPLTVSYDTTLILRKHRDISDGRYVALNHAQDIVYYVTGRYSDTHLVGWNWEQDKEVFSVPFPNSINDIAISPDDSRLLVAFGSDIGNLPGGLLVINAMTGLTEKILSDFRSYITAMSPDGQNYVSFQQIPYIEIRNINDNSLVSQDSLNVWDGGFSDAAFDATAPYIAVNTNNQHIEIHNLNTMARVRIPCDYWTGCSNKVTYDSEGKYLFDGGRILDPINGTVRSTLNLKHSNNDATIGPSGRIYAVWHYHSGYITGDKDGISVYNLDGSLWRDFQTYDGNISHIAASDKGNFIVTITSGGIDVWTIGKQWQDVSSQ